jgi:hypothetical protein
VIDPWHLIRKLSELLCMNTIRTDNESLDRLVLLLASRPREGWEDLFETLTRREVERLAPHPRQEECPVAGPSKRGVKDGTKAKEDSAYGCIIPE